MMFETLHHDTREAWLATRATCHFVNASDVPVILGSSPWKSPLRLWGELIGDIPREQSELLRMRLGHDMEPVIAKHYAEARGCEVEHWGEYTILRSTRYPLQATLDRHQIVDGKRGALELKATGFDAWINEPPLQYQQQNQAQMLVAGYDFGTLANMQWGRLPVWYDTTPHAGFVSLMLDRVRAFLEAVRTRTPPCLPDGSKASTEAVRALTKKATGADVAMLESGPTMRALELDAEIKKMKHERDAIRDGIRLAIGGGDSAYVLGGGRWTVNRGAQARLTYRRK